MSTIRVAMLCQGYTPVTGAPVCANCAHRVQEKTRQGVMSRSCALGGFFVNASGTCNKHTPLVPLKGESA